MAKFDKITVLNKIGSIGMVPVFYHKDMEVTKKVVEACYDGGVRALEFTSRDDFAQEVFAKIVKLATKKYPEMAIGIGPIIDPAIVAMYLQLGANFMVGPPFNFEIAKVCNRCSVAYTSGCGSVSEVGFTQEAGCDLCKIFSGDVCGINFMKGLTTPMPWSKLMIIGGVEPTKENLTAWIKSSVFCAGMDSKLLPKDKVVTEDQVYVTARCEEALGYVVEACK